ncbi:hypothetical protein TTRE_0000859901 [Trichuris trichiura]|uniref:Uncharacterized protein n=1 Tax=Trichuris trichiura TaxID=36087 RepID=A0A077ZNI7_TRITR|nr:hypothetical protein TTRE_0000859901 [Trichuris trichiura]
MLHEDMCERYRDNLSMTIPDWVLDPFTRLAEVEVAYQEELIEMQATEELKPKMKGGYTTLKKLKDIVDNLNQCEELAVYFTHYDMTSAPWKCCSIEQKGMFKRSTDR